jgi:hypothetical protein
MSVLHLWHKRVVWRQQQQQQQQHHSISCSVGWVHVSLIPQTQLAYAVLAVPQSDAGASDPYMTSTCMHGPGVEGHPWS